MILYARACRVSSSKVLAGNWCQGVGSKLWPTTVFVWETKLSTCSMKLRRERNRVRSQMNPNSMHQNRERNTKNKRKKQKERKKEIVWNWEHLVKEEGSEREERQGNNEREEIRGRSRRGLVRRRRHGSRRRMDVLRIAALFGGCREDSVDVFLSSYFGKKTIFYPWRMEMRFQDATWQISVILASPVVMERK